MNAYLEQPEPLESAGNQKSDSLRSESYGESTAQDFSVQIAKSSDSPNLENLLNQTAIDTSTSSNSVTGNRLDFSPNGENKGNLEAATGQINIPPLRSNQLSIQTAKAVPWTAGFENASKSKSEGDSSQIEIPKGLYANMGMKVAFDFNPPINDASYQKPATRETTLPKWTEAWSTSPGSTERRQVEKPENLERRPTDATNRADSTNPLVFSGNDALSLMSKRAMGHQLWQHSPYRQHLDNGKLADAASVSLVLKSVGYDYADSSNTGNLVKKLVSNGWQLVGVNQAKPGDVMFGGKLGTKWQNDPRNAHIGIVGENGSVYHNDNASGKWTQNNKDVAFNPSQYGDQVWVLRPPLEPPQRGNRNPQEDFKSQFDRDIRNNGSRQDGYRNDSQTDYRPSPDPFESQQNGNPESEYWKNYWKQYWHDYWRDYYGSNNRRDVNNGRNDYQRRPSDRSEPSSIEKSRRLYNTADRFVGQKVWQNSDYRQHCDDGRRGSTPSVTEVLNASGFDYVNAGHVSALARQLLSRGWTPVALNELRPGDVLYGGRNDRWQEGGGNAHVAIVGDDGMVYHNDRNTGVWTKTHVGNAFAQQEFGRRIWALRPPEKTIHVPVEQRRDWNNNGGADGNLANIARSSVGRQLWRFIRGTPARLGCAASVSAVLNAGGYKYARHAGVGGLESQLTRNGWQKMHVSQAQPGDVVIGARTRYYRQGGGGSHIGVVGENGRVYHNSSGRAKWIETSLSGYYNSSRFRAGVWILRPPNKRYS